MGDGVNRPREYTVGELVRDVEKVPPGKVKIHARIRREGFRHHALCGRPVTEFDVVEGEFKGELMPGFELCEECNDLMKSSQG